MQLLTKILENRLAIIVVVLMGILGYLGHHVATANAAFTHAYLVYAVVADDADTAAYAPTATNNVVRQELNTILVQILGNKMTDAERLAKVKRGLVLTAAAQAQIDDITPRIDAAQTAIVGMEKSVSLADAIFQKGNPQKIIALAQHRAAATRDIQSLSYRANFEMTRIFQHIDQAQGQLSSAYVSDLNNTLPGVEEEFNRRQNRYRDLQTDFDQIQQVYKDFKAAGAGAR